MALSPTFYRCRNGILILKTLPLKYQVDLLTVLRFSAGQTSGSSPLVSVACL
ncbi:MAG: hypothetical protein ACTS77_04585 [Arsenophonus sp. NC-TX2-MAG3]